MTTAHNKVASNTIYVNGNLSLKNHSSDCSGKLKIHIIEIHRVNRRRYGSNDSVYAHRRWNKKYDMICQKKRIHASIYAKRHKKKVSGPN